MVCLESDDEDDCFCIICLVAYSKSHKGEGWVKYFSCKKWAHDKYAGWGDLLYYTLAKISPDFDENLEDIKWNMITILIFFL